MKMIKLSKINYYKFLLSTLNYFWILFGLRG